jgi:hypothetical protein
VRRPPDQSTGRNMRPREGRMAEGPVSLRASAAEQAVYPCPNDEPQQAGRGHADLKSLRSGAPADLRLAEAMYRLLARGPP